MKKQLLRNINGYENFKAECDFFLCTEEYPGWTGTEKYIIVTDKTREELESKYSDLMKAMSPYIILDKSFAKPREEYLRNEYKFLWRARHKGSLFGMDERTECCYKEFADNHQEELLVDSIFIKEALSQLPEIQKRRVELYFLKGLTFQEISEIEGSSFQAVAKSIACALDKLKKYSLEG